MADEARRLYALLFHPEVAHTDRGTEILRNFAFDICGCTGDWTMASFVEETAAQITAQVGDGRVVCGLSGGVDSTVAALLIHQADRRSADVHLRRQRRDAARRGGSRSAGGSSGCSCRWCSPTPRRCSSIASRASPIRRQKRKIIGARVHRGVRGGGEAARRQFDFLAQGTLYPDVIESVSVDRPVARDQEPSQRRRPARAHALQAGRAAAAAVQGRGARGRQGAGPRRRVRLAPAVPGPGPGGADPRRGHAVAARPAAAGRRDRRGGSAEGGLVSRSCGSRSPCCCRCRASA